MRSLLLSLLLVLQVTVTSLAEAPRLINYQGRLTNASGTPVPNGSYSVNFTLYDAPSGGVPQWGETQSVTTTNGLFTVQLGSVILFSQDLFADTTLWLAIKVGADPEISPRTRLIAVPYAQNATIGGGWRDDGTGVRLNNNADYVGIGTPTPNNPLHVVDVGGGIFPVRIEGSNSLATVTELHNSTSGSTWEVGVAGSDGVFFGSIAPGSEYLYKQGTAFPSIVMTPNRRVGFGTGSPIAQLDVHQPNDTIVGYFRAETASNGGAALVGDNQSPTAAVSVGVRGKSLVSSVGIGGIFQGTYIGAIHEANRETPGTVTGSESSAEGNSSGTKTGLSAWASGEFGDKYGAYGQATGTSGVKIGLYGFASGNEISGFTTAWGGYFLGEGTQSIGVYATGAAIGLLAEVPPGNKAGWFDGDVAVFGNLTKTSGAFRIDHPLDPENKFLQHSFVESPDMKNIYDGIVTLDENGEAAVTLPDWFDALNRDVRYQLTCVGGYAPVYISSKVANNQFSIAGGTPGLEVSWMLTGIRKDPYAEAHRIQVEVEKRPHEKGRYLFPDLYGAPAELRLGQVNSKVTPDKTGHFTED